jgi:vacuolar-type H+-ATPase subunit I/STV1
VENQVVNQAEVVAKRDKMKTALTAVSMGVAGLVAAPFVFIAIGGVVGLAVAAAVGATIVALAPVFSLKIANWKYRLIDAEKVAHIKAVTGAAAENPIETLTALLIAKKGAFQEFKASVTQAITARSNFSTKVDNFKKKYPARAPEFEAQLARMTDLVERKKKALAEAQQSLEDGDNKLEEMKAYYEMSKDAIEANRAAGMDTGDAFEKLKADTACDAVFESMNMAFAQLEVAAALDVDEADKPTTSVAQLGHSEPVVIDMAQVRQTQKVSR